MIYRFGQYDLDPEIGELRKSGARVRLSGQPLEALTLLVSRKGALVTREELKELLWKQESFTDFDHGINTAIQHIRRALDDSAQTPRFIETLPRRGYHFVAPVETLEQDQRPVGDSNQRQRRLAVACVLAMAAVWAVMSGFGDRADPPRPLKFALAPGEDVHDPAISPDARYVAYVTFKREGALWIQDTASAKPRRIPGTEGALRPFWSPDSRTVGFGAGSSLWSVDVAGDGPPREICKLPVTYQGGTWSSNGEEILFSNGLFRVPAAGGVAVGSRSFEGRTGYYWDPEFLPVRNRSIALFHGMTPTDNRLAIVDVQLSDFSDLGRGRAPVYSPTGHIVYEDTGLVSRIWAQPFSLEKLATTGDRFLVAEGAFAPSVSDGGTLAYIDGDAGAIERLVWRDRSGGNQEVVSAPLPEARFVDLSPAGDSVTVAAVSGGNRRIWTVDLKTHGDQPLQFSFGEQTSIQNIPHWGPAGERIAYGEYHDGAASIWIKPTNGAKAVHAFSYSSGGVLSDFWGNGTREYLLIHAPAGPPGGPWNLQYGELLADGTATLRPLLDKIEIAVCGKISPDGQHVVYTGGEMVDGVARTGGVMVRTFPDGRGPWWVSRPGEQADQPRWSPLGDEILYVVGDQLVAAKVSTEPSFRVEAYEELFRSQGLVGHSMPMYDISPDGKRIILLDPVPLEDPTLRVSQNWYEEFRERKQE